MGTFFSKTFFVLFAFLIFLGFKGHTLNATEESAQEGGLLGADFDVGGGKGETVNKTKGQTEEEEWSGERDDYDVLSLHADMTPVTYKGRPAYQLKNVDASQVKIKMRGEEHHVDKYEATMLLLEKGFLKQVPGVGIITTKKYDRFMKQQKPEPIIQESIKDKPAASSDHHCRSKEKAFKVCQAKYGPRFSLTDTQLAEIAKKDPAWHRDVVDCLKTQKEYLHCTGR
ncbi:MAG TPA: hypothetical protein PLO78_04590 [Candidatus Omnitrophota bacterium]|nr:hypothetical protein [Candidatus Omnitrophota bacterium]